MRLLILLSALTLAGCASLPTDPASEPQSLTALATDDLTAALADAKAQGDEAAARCYAGLLELAKAQPVPRTAVKGAFSAFQKARNLVRKTQRGSPVVERINLACAPLWMSVKGDIARVAIDVLGIGAGKLPVGAAFKGARLGLGAVQ